jgi:hypothetical protein
LLSPPSIMASRLMHLAGAVAISKAVPLDLFAPAVNPKASGR